MRRQSSSRQAVRAAAVPLLLTLLAGLAAAAAAANPVPAAAAAAAASYGGSSSQARPRYVPNRVIVQLKQQWPTEAVEAAGSSGGSGSLPGLKLLQRLGAASGTGGSSSSSSATRRLLALGSSGLAVYSILDGSSVEAKVRQLEALPVVEFASPDRLLYPQVMPLDAASGAAAQAAAAGAAAAEDPSAAFSRSSRQQQQQQHGRAASRKLAEAAVPGAAPPNDKLWKQQWHLPAIDALHAWPYSRGSSTTKLCIIDTGVQRGHPDLPEPLDGWATSRGQKEGDAGFHDWNDQQFHGTHVAGIAAAVGNNSLGVAGLAWQTGLLVCRVFDASDTSAAFSSLYRCVGLCLGAGAKVVSISLGGVGYDNTYAKMARDIKAAGALLVAAAGNNGSEFTPGLEGSWDFPAGLAAAKYGYDNVIAVAATEPGGRLAGYSNYGPNVAQLAAPGSSILSTLPASTYGRINGTSMATPLVSAAAALLFAAAEARGTPATYLQVKAALLGSVDPFQDGTRYVATGGQLNVARAMRLLLFNDSTAPPPPPPPAPIYAGVGTVKKFPGVRWWHFPTANTFFQYLANQTYLGCIQACLDDLRCGKYVYFTDPAFYEQGGVISNCLLWSGGAARCKTQTCTGSEVNPDVESGLVTRIPGRSLQPPTPPRFGKTGSGHHEGLPLSPLPQQPPAPSPQQQQQQPPPPRPKPGPSPPPTPRPHPPPAPPPLPLAPPPPLRLLAWQSSKVAAAGASAGRALDGNSSTYSSTAAQRNPWWAVDLRRRLSLAAVVITLRGDRQYNLSSLHDLEVRAGSTAPPRRAGGDPSALPLSANPLCVLREGRVGGRRGSSVTLRCTGRMEARYVTLQIRSQAGASNDVLSLAEVTVAGRLL